MDLPRHESVELVVRSIYCYPNVQCDRIVYFSFAPDAKLDEILERIVPLATVEDFDDNALLQVGIANVRALLDVASNILHKALQPLANCHSTGCSVIGYVLQPIGSR